MDITNDIISFIFSEKQLSLPGLGVLALSKKTAHRSPTKTKIYGPKFTIDFDDSISNEAINDRFYQFVAIKHNKSKNRVKDELNKYSVEILNNLANFNSAQIKNLGIFKRVDDKIQFEFSPIFNDLIRESYPDFPLLLIDRKTDDKDEKSVQIAIPNEKITQKTKSHTKKQGWFFPLIVLTLLSLGFVCLMYCLSNILPANKNNDINQKKQNNIITDTTLNEKVHIKHLSESNDTQKAQTLKEMPDNSQNSTKSSEEEIKNLEKISLEELINLGPELKSNYTKSCIIIVGSFKRKSNSSRMKLRLLKDKFTPYVEKYGKFYRTGVVFDCDKKPLYTFLKELRNSIDKGSWVLKYK